jgi:hypothetical protein
MAGKLVIRINRKTGEMSVKAEDTLGPGCVEKVRAITQKLGDPDHEEHTDDYYSVSNSQNESLDMGGF